MVVRVPPMKTVHCCPIYVTSRPLY